jgi:predicted ABC-type ATPase
MSKRLIILAPSAGGKSTLMRYLRENSNLSVFEMDEEVMSANGDKWPDDNNYKDTVLVPQIVAKIINKPNAIYIASYVPEVLLKKARSKGFCVVLINVTLVELTERNKKRMEAERYADSTPWLQLQLNTFNKLVEKGLIDHQIDGHKDIDNIARKIVALAN